MTVCHFNTNSGSRTARRAQQIGHDVHHPSLHADVKLPTHQVPHVNGIHSVVARAGVILAEAADECSILDACHIIDVAARVIGIRMLLLV